MSSNYNYNNKTRIKRLTRYWKDRLRDVSDWPYLKERSLEKIIAFGEMERDAAYQYSWKEYKRKLEGGGFNVSQIFPDKTAKSYPSPSEVRSKMFRHDKDGTLGMTDKELLDYIERYEKIYKNQGLNSNLENDPPPRRYKHTFQPSSTTDYKFLSGGTTPPSVISTGTTPSTTTTTTSYGGSRTSDILAPLTHALVDGTSTTFKEIWGKYKYIIVLLVSIIIFVIIIIFVVDFKGKSKDNSDNSQTKIPPSTDEPASDPPSEPPTHAPNDPPPVPPSPIDCVGSWEEVAEATCSEQCGGGTIEEEYKISQQAENGGKACSNKQGDKRNTKPCITQSCPDGSINCLGAWEEVAEATCSEKCGGGTIEEEYKISQQAENGGKACSNKQGDKRNTKVCNTQACPTPDEECINEEGVGTYVINYWGMFLRAESGTETYVSKGGVECNSNYKIDGKKCIKDEYPGNTTYRFVYKYSPKQDPYKPDWDEDKDCDPDECHYIVYGVKDQPMTDYGITSADNKFISKILNKKGESLSDRLIKDIWCRNIIKPEDFEDVLQYIEWNSKDNSVMYKEGVDPEELVYNDARQVRVVQLVIPRAQEYPGVVYYNYGLQLLYCLLALKKAGRPKPKEIVWESVYNIRSTV